MRLASRLPAVTAGCSSGAFSPSRFCRRAARAAARAAVAAPGTNPVVATRAGFVPAVSGTSLSRPLEMSGRRAALLPGFRWVTRRDCWDELVGCIMPAFGRALLRRSGGLLWICFAVDSAVAVGAVCSGASTRAGAAGAAGVGSGDAADASYGAAITAGARGAVISPRLTFRARRDCTVATSWADDTDRSTSYD